MHTMHRDPQAKRGPETTGAVIHWTPQHDIFVRLMGLGVDGSNSRMVVEMAKIKPGDKVLDVGCGTGDLTLTAKKYAGASGSAHGIDASPEGIAIARKKAERSGDGAVFDVGLIEKLAYPDATFDVVISRLVIHHLPDELKRQGFKEIYRVLKPGGLFFLVDFKPPSNPVLAHVFFALSHHRMTHSNVWGLAPMLTETGFVAVASGPTRSALLAFVSGKKPTALVLT
ncbi:MAG: methyltransferase domain-containing protein [Chloroflexi bacterium]|nr:methyltransferase domain-containing protein [Chloroflexota bacterium]